MKFEDLYDAAENVSTEYMENLKDLWSRMTEVENAYGKPLIVTSGFRTVRNQVETYRKINKQRFLENKEAIPVPMHSMHMSGCAVDVHDPRPMMDLKIWVKLHEPLIKDIGLWMESFDYTPTWIHFQSRPPKSGSLYFKPF